LRFLLDLGFMFEVEIFMLLSFLVDLRFMILAESMNFFLLDLGFRFDIDGFSQSIHSLGEVKLLI
jgi:hypothetical protein